MIIGNCSITITWWQIGCRHGVLHLGSRFPSSFFVLGSIVLDTFDE
jgi:hypothetical protein